MESVFLGAVAIILTWLTAGVLMLCFAPVFVQRGAPLGAKVALVARSAAVMPMVFIMHGAMPAIVLATEDMPPEEEERFSRWKAQFCQCPGCRAERGE